MAWGAKARNNSAISRNVNYHEDEGPSGNNNNNNGGGNRGGGSKIMRVVAVGFAIYMVANIGLGGAGEVLSNIGDALDILNGGEDYSILFKFIPAIFLQR